MKKFMMSLFVLVLLFMPKTYAQDYDTYPVYGESFHVDMFVFEDGRVHVKTDAKVMFNAQRQGIFVTIPIEYKNYDFSGFTGSEADKNKKYYFPIKNFESTTHRFEEEDRSSKGVVYKMGEAGVYLEGLESFKYEYDILLRDLNLSDHSQLFLMNLIGEEWAFPYKEIHYRIEFDKDIQDSLIRFQTSYLDELTDFTVKDNVISGVYQQAVGQGNALTILVDVPDNYFAFKSLDYSLPAIAILAVLMVLTIVLRMRIDAHPIVDSVEFTAPSGLNSADVAYIYKNELTSKDVVSLIMYWAHQGFLKIKEHSKDDIELIKVKDIQTESNDEKMLFDALFDNRDSVFISALKNSFYSHINRAIVGIKHSFTKDAERRLYTRKSGTISILSTIMLIVMAMIAGGVGFYKNYGIFDQALIGISIGGIVTLVSAILGFVLYQLSQKGSMVSFLMKMFYVLLGAVSPAIILILSVFTDMNMIYASAMSIMIFISYFMATTSYQRSKQGARWFGQVLGLKRFIETTEVERLKMFVEETPYIFYDILPYAYVLGLSNVWAKKFETIAIQEPEWYQSTSTRPFSPYYLTRSLNRNMSVMSATMSSVPASKGSSGGGFRGGGGSSGGSFGGGGFGGGGGGSW